MKPRALIRRLQRAPFRISRGRGREWSAQRRWLPFAAGACLLLAGCAHSPYGLLAIQPDGMQPAKPVVAVMDLENRAGFHGKWSLGEGMADMLVTELLDTERVIVLERRELGSVVDEILRQGKALFRPEGRVAGGRLKNAQYLLHGAVTDFAVTGDASGWFGEGKKGGWFSGSRATVSLHLRVSDVESGEILSSVRADGSAASWGFGAAVDYRDVHLGGDAFFRTPLGRATEKALERAVKQILRDLPSERRRIRVAEAGPESIILNAGRNFGIRPGETFIIRREGRAVTDPATGDVLDTMPGRETGLVEVYEVNPTISFGRLLEGSAVRGDIAQPK
jgi:curli biogenesis system outer membrane secretion channel CsgG